jgi:hypothetical protein
MSDFIKNKNLKLATVSNIDDYKEGVNTNGADQNGI